MLMNLDGSVGDIRPFLALGLTLRKAGYEVENCAPHNLKPLCSQYNFNTHSFGYDSQKVMEEQGKEIIGQPRKSIKTAFFNLQKESRINFFV